MSEEEPVQMPAARLSDRHVDHAIVLADRADRWLQRRETFRWLASPVRWFVANLKDIASVAGILVGLLAAMNSLGWIDLESWPAFVITLLEGLGG